MLAGLVFVMAAFAAAPAEPGFVPLFNGKDLSGWKLVGGRGAGYVVEKGMIVCPADGGGNLFTEKEYADFILRLDFRLSDGGNNGVGIRAPYEGDAAYQGMEIQVLDHYAARYAKLEPWQLTGSIYNVFPSMAPKALKKAGVWNTYEITAQGRHITVKLNGTVTADADLDSVTDPEVLKKHPGLKRAAGHIGFLGHGTKVEFCNVRLKPLP
ncbi:MAG TPA: DUF1080 domain-containing protein [Bryobacteraceae bacterium]|nr:DUF1080 domain-containing protein [Bryobacteraceae bacterium]